MKTKIGQITATTFFALVFLVGTAYAEGMEESALSYENIEGALEIENWMVNDSVWNTDDFILFEMELAFIAELETALEIDVEDALEIETWMVDDNTFKMEPNFIMQLETALEIEIEETLEIEDWMLIDKNFNLANRFEIETATEEALKIESWMTDEYVWNK